MVCSLRSKLWPPRSGQCRRLRVRYASKEASSAQEAEIPGGCGLRVGRPPALQMRASTRASELLLFVPSSLRSCCYAGDAVAFQPGCADDYRLLPLHVHGVGVPGASPRSAAPLTPPLPSHGS